MKRQELQEKLTSNLTKLWNGQREDPLWFEYRGYQVMLRDHSEGWEYSIADKDAEHDPDEFQFEDEVEGGVIDSHEILPSEVVEGLLVTVDNL